MNKSVFIYAPVIMSVILAAWVSSMAYQNHTTLAKLQDDIDVLATARPEIIWLPAAIEKPVEVERKATSEVQVKQEKTVEADSIEEPSLRNLKTFSNMEELVIFLDNWVFRGSFHDGKFTFGGEQADCDDFAIQFLEDVVEAGHIGGIVLDPVKSHLLNAIPIGNSYYFVDATDKTISDNLNGKRWFIDFHDGDYDW